MIEGNLVSSVGSSNQLAVSSYPVSAEGGASWEFTVEKDKSGNEMACFGFSRRKPSSTKYTTSDEMWMLRGYNGRAYHNGEKPVHSKVHPGDKVKIVLSNGQATYYVNGTNLGVLFSGITGIVHPAVAFYGADRAVRLRMDGVSYPDAGSPKFLTTMKSGGTTISEDGSVVSSTMSGEKCYAACGGSYTSGTHEWTFVCEKDEKGNEMCCYGMAKDAVADSKYGAWGLVIKV